MPLGRHPVAALATGRSRAAEEYSRLSLGLQRSVAVGVEGSHVMQVLGRHGGRNRCQSNEMTTAQHRAAHTVKDLVYTASDRVDMALVIRHGEPTQGDAHDHRDAVIAT
jgi:hypothetical protein